MDSFPIVGSFEKARTSTLSSQRTVNWYEYRDPEGKKPEALFPTSGLVNTNLVFETTTKGSRGTFVFKDYIYQVFGNTIYRLNGENYDSLTVEILQAINTTSGYVGITANTTQVIFVDGLNGWIYDTTTDLMTQIIDAAFPIRPIDVTYLDGFFVVISGETNQFYLSTYEQGLIWGVGFTAPGGSPPTKTFTADPAAGADWLIMTTTENFQTGVPFTVSNSGGALPTPLVAGTTYYSIRVDSTHIRVATSNANAAIGNYIDLTSAGTGTQSIENEGQLQEAQITSSPGTLVACRTLHRQLFLFSQNFTEVWTNAGAGTNLPFRRNNSLLMEYGCAAIGSIAVGFDRMFFLSQTAGGLGPVMRVAGSEALPISDPDLDYQLAQIAYQEVDGILKTADAAAFLVQENGIIFYRLNFTMANHTYVYNESFSSPQQRLWHEEEVLNGDRHPGETHAYYKGKNYFVDYQSTLFYLVDGNESTNAGEAIKRMRISKTIAPPGYQRMRIDRFHLDVMQGTVGTQYSDPVYLNTEDSKKIITESGNFLITDDSVLIPGPTPEIFLSISKDGGQSFGYIYQSSMGAIGERTWRTVWRKLGTIPRGQGFTVKIEFYNNTPLYILGAAWAMAVLPE